MHNTADDSAKVDFLAQYEWRGNARRSRMGKFVHPYMKEYRWSVYERVQDLKDRPESVELQQHIPEYYDDPDDEELSALLGEPQE